MPLNNDKTYFTNTPPSPYQCSISVLRVGLCKTVTHSQAPSRQIDNQLGFNHSQFAPSTSSRHIN